MFVNSCTKMDAKLIKNMYNPCNFFLKNEEITTFYRTFAEKFTETGILLLSVTNRNRQIEDAEAHHQLDRMEPFGTIPFSDRCHPSALLSGHHWAEGCPDSWREA
jgi:hypothetical protein